MNAHSALREGDATSGGHRGRAAASCYHLRVIDRRATRLVAIALLALAATTPTRAARGPSTEEERERALALVEVLETAPASPEAAEARTWLLQFLSEVPDVTAKQCYSLLGTPAERQGIRPELLAQHLFSGAAYLIRHPGAGSGSTETLTAAVAGTVRAYRAWKAVDATVTHPRLEQLLALEAQGGLEQYARGTGRSCL